MDPMMLRYSMGITSRNAHAVITSLPDPDEAVADALANLEEHSPDEAALLREHTGCGRSTDWNRGEGQ